MNRERLLRRLLQGSFNNVAFRDFSSLVEGFGFRQIRVRGSHHIFEHPTLPEQLNIQDYRGEAKAYQLRQFLDLVERYDLHLEED